MTVDKEEGHMMLKAIASAIARLFKFGVGALRWTENLLFSPFRAIFGGGGALPRPEFTPNMSSTELLEEYDANRQAQAALQRSDRDGIGSVIKYAAASPSVRATTDLSSVPADARIMLLTMDDHELAALSTAGPVKVRKWVEGRDHGIFGIPAVTPTNSVKPVPLAMQPPAGMTHQQRIVWRVQAHLGKPDHSKEFRLA
ncbi:hypothetical protein PZB21_26020 [Rhizobium sp. CBK13]|uniref:hypothetical protein n=1 Tax=Rhizobium sp. CBK13 TaxID=3031399 RepID=UPI0023AF7320|nr:hypothetical protein [Rhizobium sp. CBK13]MDE8762630.1 hypothetical protein [Rhizobium sp. CBK13]